MRFSSYKLRGKVEWSPLRRGAWSKNMSVVDLRLRDVRLNIRDGLDVAMSPPRELNRRLTCLWFLIGG